MLPRAGAASALMNHKDEGDAVPLTQSSAQLVDMMLCHFQCIAKHDPARE